MLLKKQLVIYCLSSLFIEYFHCYHVDLFDIREHGMKDDRFMVSIPATPEGLEAMKKLNGSVRVNATCVFSLMQAIKAAEAGARAVSVGVGDLSDYWRWKTGYESPAWDDRGVQLCTSVQTTLRSLGHQNTLTVAMNCRTVSQVLELAGIDCIAVAPWMLYDLAGRSSCDVYRHLDDRPATRANKQMLRKKAFDPWPEDALVLLGQAQTRWSDCLVKLNQTITKKLSSSPMTEP